jgi:hypothetical protein
VPRIRCDWRYAPWRGPGRDDHQNVVPEYQVVKVLNQEKILFLVCERHLVQWQLCVETQVKYADIGSCRHDRLDRQRDTFVVYFVNRRGNKNVVISASTSICGWRSFCRIYVSEHHSGSYERTMVAKRLATRVGCHEGAAPVS